MRLLVPCRVTSNGPKVTFSFVYFRGRMLHICKWRKRMTRTEFQRFCKEEKMVFLDGATGSNYACVPARVYFGKMDNGKLRDVLIWPAEDIWKRGLIFYMRRHLQPTSGASSGNTAWRVQIRQVNHKLSSCFQKSCVRQERWFARGSDHDPANSWPTLEAWAGRADCSLTKERIIPFWKRPAWICLL